ATPGNRRRPHWFRLWPSRYRFETQIVGRDEQSLAKSLRCDPPSASTPLARRGHMQCTPRCQRGDASDVQQEGWQEEGAVGVLGGRAFGPVHDGVGGGRSARRSLTSLSATSTTLYPCAARGPVVDPGAPAAAPIPKV